MANSTAGKRSANTRINTRVNTQANTRAESGSESKAKFKTKAKAKPKLQTKAKAERKAPGIGAHHDHIALVLQGGGALGAYQAGVFEELASTAYQPAWIAGVSIGAINAALIAGNLPERRIERLSEFWHLVSSGMGAPVAGAHGAYGAFGTHGALSAPGALGLGAHGAQDAQGARGTRGLHEALFAPWAQSASEWVKPRTAFNQLSAMWSALAGIPGFYQPRVPPVWLQPEGTPAALGIYDTAPLRATLEKLIDFDLINSKRVRLSLGAVNVMTGNSVYFDNTDRIIGPEHVMASGALPPAFPPVMIDGQPYWDGGIVSNTPLQYILDMRGKDTLRDSLLVFQVDLFSARGTMPVNLAEVQQRQKDILYSSRTRYNSDVAAKVSNARAAVRALLAKLPPELMDDPHVKHLADAVRTSHTDIVQLIYRQASYELESKDYEFSRVSVLEHWQAGQRDMRDTITHPEWLKSTGIDEGVTQYDLTRHTRPL